MWMFAAAFAATTLRWTPAHSLNEPVRSCQLELGDAPRWQCDDAAWRTVTADLSVVERAEDRVNWWREAHEPRPALVGGAEAVVTRTLPAGELTVTGGSRSVDRLLVALEALVTAEQAPALYAPERPLTDSPEPIAPPPGCVERGRSFTVALVPWEGPQVLDILVCQDDRWLRFEDEVLVARGRLDEAQRRAFAAAVDATLWDEWEPAACLEFEPLSMTSLAVSGYGRVFPGPCRWGPGAGEELERFFWGLGR